MKKIQERFKRLGNLKLPVKLLTFVLIALFFYLAIIFLYEKVKNKLNLTTKYAYPKSFKNSYAYLTNGLMSFISNRNKDLEEVKWSEVWSLWC